MNYWGGGGFNMFYGANLTLSNWRGTNIFKSQFVVRACQRYVTNILYKSDIVEMKA